MGHSMTHQHLHSSLYAGTFGGGVFQSTDMGASWVAINNGLTGSRVEALSLDPGNPSTLYAGTSDGGVFKSTDMGASWVAINSGLINISVRALAVDPTNPSTLYAGTSGGGVSKSTDGGGNWEGISTGLTNTAVRALAVDPSNPSILYAGTDGGLFKSSGHGSQLGGDQQRPDQHPSPYPGNRSQQHLHPVCRHSRRGGFKSSDGGANWVGINNGLTNNSLDSLAIDPASASTLYAGTLGGGVFKSTDGGDNWVGTNNGLTSTFIDALAVDPGGTSTLYTGTQGRGVFKSTDEGGNWVGINSGLTNTFVRALAIDPTNPATLHVGTQGGGVFSFVQRPGWLYAAGNPLGTEAQFDGLALTNFSNSSDTANLVAVSSRSGIASVQTEAPRGNGNQATVVLEAGQQTALLRTDLFEGDPNEPAWIELTSDTGEIGTFFQFGTGTLSQLDGGVAITETSDRIVLTRVLDGPTAFGGQPVTTRVSILNPNEDPVTIDLEYRPAGNQGATQGTSSLTTTIAGRSFLDEQAADLFGLNLAGEGAQLSGGIITGEVTEGEGVVAFEVIQLTNQSTVLGLNAATGNPTTRAYSAQLAYQPGLFTSVNVFNGSDGARNVTLRAVGEDGSQHGDAVAMVLDPGEQFTGDAAQLFGAAAGPNPAQRESFVGSLVVEADGEGVVGDVIFGDSASFAFAASLPLQTETFTEALFNQVANVSGFFTGLAFFYPVSSQEGSPQGPQPDAEVTIQVFRPSGEMVGLSVVTLAPGERISQLVEQLVGDIELAGGYVRVFSTGAIIGQMLFGVIGPGGIQLFSAVPPTVVSS